MSLLIRDLKLEATTPDGQYGVDFSFSKGLNIVRAGNSSGKSTCVQAIVYALGLEGMIGKKHEVPLPHCMTEMLEDGGREHKILESWVMLEIQNQAGEILTIRRAAKSESEDIHLISTWAGPALTSRAADALQHDYFVRLPGAAQRERGFHTRLARFLGWDLPSVPRYDGEMSPLYLECIFPLMIVEQKHGWSGIQASVPVHYGIKDAAKRSVEFVLSLEAYSNALKRESLSTEKETTKTKWADLVRECTDVVKRAGGVWQGLTREPTTDWPPTVQPEMLFPDGNAWITYGAERAKNAQLLTEFQDKEIASVGASVEGVRAELSKTYENLRTTEIVATGLLEDVQTGRAEYQALNDRITALQEDLLRHQDINRLKNLGSLEVLEIAHDICPTCHQSIRESLLPQDATQVIMSIDQNIDFIEGQLKTFENMRTDAEEVLAAKEQQIGALRKEAEELRAQIRAQRTTLTSPDQVPAISELRRRLRIEERARELRELEEMFSVPFGRFETLSKDWKRILKDLAALPPDDLSKEDKDKLRTFQELLVGQLKDYGFSSVAPNLISISPETYRPIHEEGFDLGFDLSATDMIRLIWSYLIGLMELGGTYPLNHPNFIIFDEPRQHEMDKHSYA
ncbi:MAG TPA: hypothetical protein VGZ48_00540 [Candidatus Acidoferrales bacterium]|nr:hypothetical protein [Candidatus Acidoferrales bacterium]